MERAVGRVANTAAVTAAGHAGGCANDGTRQGSTREAWREAWAAALDELELSLEGADQLLRGETDAAPGPWVPPQLDGPPPGDLLPRAQLLLARQAALARQVETAAGDARRQLALVDRVTEARRSSSAAPPVYVDISM